MDTKKIKYTLSQLMVAAAAREIKDNEIIFVGMRLPLLGFLLAKSTHASNSVGVYELGIVRETLAPAPILTMGDLPNLFKAFWLSDTADIMSLLQRGLVDASFIGGAQVDKYGNLNTSYVGNITNIETRLPGSGGACDLASLAKRHIIIMAHQKHRFVEKVDYITSPGYGNGGTWREENGLIRGGPSTVITTMGVLKFDKESKEMILESIHPGIVIDDIINNTGWKLNISENLKETKMPSEHELIMLNKFDPEGYWTGE